MNGMLDFTPCTIKDTRSFLAYGFDLCSSEIQNIMGAMILPKEFFNPIDGNRSELHCTEKTHAIHWRSGLWGKPVQRIGAKIRIFLGLERMNKLKYLSFLFAALVSVGCMFTSCDDDDNFPIENQIAGEYKGTLDVSMAGQSMATDMPQNITVDKAASNAINLTLANFSIAVINILVNDLTMLFISRVSDLDIS